MLDFQATTWLIDKKVPTQTGNHHPYMTPMGVYPASDGSIVIGASSHEQYRRFCAAIGAPELVDDPRFHDAPTRKQNRDAFTKAVSSMTSGKPSAYWVECLNKAGVACGPIYTVDQMFEDPQVRMLNMARTVQHPRLGPLQVIGTGFRLASGDAPIDKAAPEKGEHTDAVLSEAAFSASEISELRSKQIVQ
jgi:formyl-CoA transferase